MKLLHTLLTAIVGTSTWAAAQQPVALQLDASKKGAPIASTMYGLFFEDINYGADGGLYAEMVKNRSFEFPQNLMGWKTFGKVSLLTQDAPFQHNPHYVRLATPGHAHKHTGLENEGFFGFGIQAKASYRFSVWARVPENAEPQTLRVELVDAHNEATLKGTLEISGHSWKKYELILNSEAAQPNSTLRIFFTGSNAVDLEHISLFPADTYKGRENGLRKDLAQALADLNPGVFRFPGGCIVEGTDLESRYDWKKSVGPVENRPLNENRWHYTFPHRFYPDYFQSYGMGFYEFFLLSEDMGAEPLPVLSCGLACQFQNEESHAHVPVGQLECYIQDALDLIEFANGDAQTQWGALRASMGHPAPFNLKYIGIGNEQWGKEYPERLEPFVKAIRQAYPKIQLIGSSGPSSEGKEFEYLWPEMKRLKVDLVDEHYYRPEEWFLSNAARYDQYDRKGPKVFAGEYACHPKNRKNNFESALCEAAFMTGLERNADIVRMTTYAPLFAHVQGWQWRPDLIWFDNMRSVKSANYYVQQLYATHAGTHVASLLKDGKPLAGQEQLYASAAFDDQKKCYYLKIANTASHPQTLKVQVSGLKKNQTLHSGQSFLMQNHNLDQENTLDQPDAILPIEIGVTTSGNSLSYTIGAKSFVLVTLLVK